MNVVRTRLAPSPTGFLHIGTARTAIYNYLIAKQSGGQFILRIEDTDQGRYVEGATEAIFEGLKWLGLIYDEGPDVGGPFAPYIQTERLKRHKEAADELIQNGHAYRCFCTPERLTELREIQKLKKLPPAYDRKCRSLSQEEIDAHLSNGDTFTIRLKMPLEGEIICEDAIRGKISFPAKDIDDPILLKTDGYPTYHLAAIIDDHDMEITHVIRTEEWLPSYPKHAYLYTCFGWEQPVYLHGPLVLNDDRSKMSKRKGDVALSSYIKKGYLKEALINFLVLLGWSGPNDKEFWTIEELIESFDFTKVHKSGAIFKPEKLDFFNAHYIRQKSVEELTEILIEYLATNDLLEEKDDVTLLLKGSLNIEVSRAVFELMVRHGQGRLVTLSDFFPALGMYFKKEMQYAPELLTNEKMKTDINTAKQSIDLLVTTLEAFPNEDWELDKLKNHLLATIAENGMKNGQVLWPMRSALTGETQSPGAFEVAEILGKEETLKRLKVAREILSSF
ncbi:MAG: glutamate--tRNA ligase [Candidatus Gracilibacteria bacterium]